MTFFEVLGTKGIIFEVYGRTGYSFRCSGSPGCQFRGPGTYGTVSEDNCGKSRHGFRHELPSRKNHQQSLRFFIGGNLKFVGLK